MLLFSLDPARLVNGEFCIVAATSACDMVRVTSLAGKEFTFSLPEALKKGPVASDPDRKIATSYNLTAGSPKAGMKDVRGADIDHDFIERVTFVIGKDHKIVATLSSADDKISPDQHVHKALEIVQSLVSK
jgi:peroxiredoxin